VKRLGDVARLAKSPARARAAYEALRRRAPGSDAAAVAAFELGRLAFDEARAYDEARRWFAAYVGERPRGALAQEALGRLVEAHQRAGDRAAARDAARTYLARFPDGPHARLAAELSGP
jgi:TolA-binding protein